MFGLSSKQCDFFFGFFIQGVGLVGGIFDGMGWRELGIEANAKG